MRKAAVFALLGAAAIGIAVFIGSHMSPSDGVRRTVEAAPPVARTHRGTPEHDAIGRDDSSAPAAIQDGDPDTNPVEDTPPSCDRFRADPSHPWVMAEIARIEPLAPSGPGMAVYRGLSAADLISLAAQKDSGAMIVLAKRAELRAEGGAEDDAVKLLDGQQSVVSSWSSRDAQDPDTRAALVEAERWYYQAALHGRIFAMFHVGMLRNRLLGGPVELGWIDADEYAELETKRRSDFYPAVVYGAAATALVPQIMQSPLMTLALEGLDTLPGDTATVDLVISEFRADLEQNGLALPSVPPYEGPGIDEWRAEFCNDD